MVHFKRILQPVALPCRNCPVSQIFSLALTIDYTLFHALGLQIEKTTFPTEVVQSSRGNREADASRQRFSTVWSAPGKDE